MDFDGVVYLDSAEMVQSQEVLDLRIPVLCRRISSGMVANFPFSYEGFAALHGALRTLNRHQTALQTLVLLDQVLAAGVPRDVLLFDLSSFELLGLLRPWLMEKASA